MTSLALRKNTQSKDTTITTETTTSSSSSLSISLPRNRRRIQQQQQQQECSPSNTTTLQQQQQQQQQHSSNNNNHSNNHNNTLFLSSPRNKKRKSFLSCRKKSSLIFLLTILSCVMISVELYSLYYFYYLDWKTTTTTTTTNAKKQSLEISSSSSINNNDKNNTSTTNHDNDNINNNPNPNNANMNAKDDPTANRPKHSTKYKESLPEDRNLEQQPPNRMKIKKDPRAKLPKHYNYKENRKFEKQNRVKEFKENLYGRNIYDNNNNNDYDYDYDNNTNTNTSIDNNNMELDERFGRLRNNRAAHLLGHGGGMFRPGGAGGRGAGRGGGGGHVLRGRNGDGNVNGTGKFFLRGRGMNPENRRTCNELFSIQQFYHDQQPSLPNNTSTSSTNQSSSFSSSSLSSSSCVGHVLMPYTKACQLGSIIIDTSKIKGSLGGENITQVINREESMEQLQYEKGALLFYEHYMNFVEYYYNQNEDKEEQQQYHRQRVQTKVNDTQILQLQEEYLNHHFPLSKDILMWEESYSEGMIHLLQSGLVMGNELLLNTMNSAPKHDDIYVVRGIMNPNNDNNGGSYAQQALQQRLRPPPQQDQDQEEERRRQQLRRHRRDEDTFTTTSATASTYYSNTTAILVKRGDYANPCMTILDMFNVFITLRTFGMMKTEERTITTNSSSSSGGSTATTDSNSLMTTATTSFHYSIDTPVTILWLDGHAQGNLDNVWEILFESQPYHLKQLSMFHHHHHHNNNDNKNDNHDATTTTTTTTTTPASVQFANAIAINTKSVVGEEGLMMYDWRIGTNNVTKNCTLDPKVNTLIQFRNFVLDKFQIHNISPSPQPLIPPRRQLSFENQNTTTTTTTTTTHGNDHGDHHHDHRRGRLTFLVRRNYMAHPRSNGRTDRVLANETRDVAYLQRLYPNYDITVVSFESMSFREQLVQIATQTDLFVSIHGAGNIHALFLPNDATFVEYFPNGYHRRMRFRFLSECLNLTYIAKRAWIVNRFEAKTKVSLRLEPRDEYEEEREYLHEPRGMLLRRGN